MVSSPKSPNGSPKASTASPKASNASPKASNAFQQDEIDMSLISWVMNTHNVLQWPLTILCVAGLVVAGAFAEIAPRKSLEFLDNMVGRSIFFVLPILTSLILDWPTGLLAAVVSLIVFARLQKEDSTEGFSDTVDDTSGQSTKIISNSHRWFVERMLGERPVAISSGRIITSAVEGEDDNRLTNNSSSSSNFEHVPLSPGNFQSSSSSHK